MPPRVSQENAAFAAIIACYATYARYRTKLGRAVKAFSVAEAKRILTLAKFKSVVAGCAGTGCGCFALTAFVVIVFPIVFRGCGDTKQAIPVTKAGSIKAILTQKERLAKRQEQVAEKRAAQKEAARKASYEKAYAKFEQYILSLPGVRGTQRLGDDGFRVFVAGPASDYEVRKVGQVMYDQFVAIRRPYMSESDAQNCLIFVYDDTGQELGTTSEWNR